MPTCEKTSQYKQRKEILLAVTQECSKELVHKYHGNEQQASLQGQLELQHQALE